MYQIDNATAATTQPASTAAGTAGFFTDGNPATSTPATIVPAEWLNAMMMELANVVTGAGLTLAKSQFNQVLSSIKRLGQSTIVLADTGAANAYTAVNAPPLVAGTWVDGVVQQVKIAHTNTGASTYAPDGLTAIPIYGLGLQPLQGGELALNGTAVLMHATIAGVNSGNPICVLMECAGGAQQVAPATQSQHAVQFGQVAAVVGSARNVKASIATAGTSITISADETVAKTALGGVAYVNANWSDTLNIATTGAGGMDTGSAPVNGFVAIYRIYNPATATWKLLGYNATSAAAPNVYGGANMPAGYTASVLTSVWPTNGSGQFVVGQQADRTVGLAPTLQINTTTQQTSLTSLTVTTGVAPNAKAVYGEVSVQSTVSSALSCSTAGSANSLMESNFASQNAVQIRAPMSRTLLTTPQTIYYTASVGSGTMTFQLWTTGYDF